MTSITVIGENIIPEINIALNLMECRKDNPAYNQLQGLFLEEKSRVCELIKPRAAFKLLEECSEKYFEMYPGLYSGERIISLMTLGSDISSYIDECTKKDLMRGLLVGFMADSCLFEFEKQVNQKIREYLLKMNRGVSRILEPSKHLPSEYQKIICDKLDAYNKLGVSLTKGYMLNPIKSMSKVYVISGDVNEFNTTHDCNNCMIKCPLKDIK